ncbi:MAG: prepilin-type N-terminal cleavage/methylation domain-containing protein, partial [Nitrospiraceae bacterium]
MLSAWSSRALHPEPFAGHPDPAWAGEGPAFSFRSGRIWAAGFTLIELIIVISIILILLSVAAPIYRTSVIRSKEAVLRD